MDASGLIIILLIIIGIVLWIVFLSPKAREKRVERLRLEAEERERQLRLEADLRAKREVEKNVSKKNETTI